MEKWKMWDPNISIHKFMYSKSSYITEKGLILGFEDEDYKKITISFLDGYLSNRETDEDGIYDTLCDIYAYANEEKWKAASFLTVENSEYVRWFKEQNFDKYKDVEIGHYIIIACDIISEVLSTGAPKIEVSE